MQKELVEEKLILEKIAAGDQESFRILYNFYRNKVYGYALALLQLESSSQEIVQEIFIKLWLKRESLSTIDNFGGYLRVIVRNATLNALKKIALQQKNYSAIHITNTEVDASTENFIQYRETKRLLDLAVEKLPPQQKLIYNKCHVEGLKQKEVAIQLNISPLTVKAHLKTAIKSIRNYIELHNEVKMIGLILFILK